MVINGKATERISPEEVKGDFRAGRATWAPKAVSNACRTFHQDAATADSW